MLAEDISRKFVRFHIFVRRGLEGWDSLDSKGKVLVHDGLLILTALG